MRGRRWQDARRRAQGARREAAQGTGRETRGARREATAATNKGYSSPDANIALVNHKATAATRGGYSSPHRLQQPGYSSHHKATTATKKRLQQPGYSSHHEATAATKQGYSSQDANIALVNHGLQQPPQAIAAPILRIARAVERV